MSGGAHCPTCGTRSSHRHGWCIRHLRDLPAQGVVVKLLLRECSGNDSIPAARR
ncbi:transposase family protein [Acidisoma silvae]